MTLWSFSSERMEDLKNRAGEELNVKVVYEGEPFIVKGIVESVEPFISMTVEEELVTKLATKETFKCAGLAILPFVWKGFGIEVVSKDFSIVEEKEIYKDILYENAWVEYCHRIKDDNLILELMSAIYGDDIARKALPKIEKEQKREEKLKKAWIKTTKRGGS